MYKTNSACTVITKYCDRMPYNRYLITLTNARYSSGSTMNTWHCDRCVLPWPVPGTPHWGVRTRRSCPLRSPGGTRETGPHRTSRAPSPSNTARWFSIPAKRGCHRQLLCRCVAFLSLLHGFLIQCLQGTVIIDQWKWSRATKLVLLDTTNNKTNVLD